MAIGRSCSGLLTRNVAAQQYIKERPHDHMRGRLCPFGRNFKIAEALGKEACNGKVGGRRPPLLLCCQAALLHWPLAHARVVTA